MPTRAPTFSFITSVEKLDRQPPFQILPIPDLVACPLRKARVRRLIATINGYEVKRALMNHADGGSFLIISRAIIKEARLREGHDVRVTLRADPQPTRLDMPEEFRLVLTEDSAARTRWETFPVGRRRSLLSYIQSARTEPTRIKRSLELARKIRLHQLFGDKPAGQTKRAEAPAS